MKKPIIIPDKSSWPIRIYLAFGCVYAICMYFQDLIDSSFLLIVSVIALTCVIIVGIIIGWMIIFQKRIVLLPFVGCRIRKCEKTKGVETAKNLYEKYASRKNQIALAILFASPSLGFIILMLLLLGKSLFK